MFSSIRYASIVVFGICVAIILALSFYFKSMLFESIVKTSLEREARAVSASYIKNVWNRYQGVANFLATRPLSEWNNYPQYKNFADESNELLLGNSYLKVNIISLDGQNLFFETNPDVMVKKNPSSFLSLGSNEDITKALRNTQSQVGNTLISNAIVTSKGIDSKKTLYKVVLPLFSPLNKPGNDVGNLNFANIEFFFDVSNHIKNIEAVQFSLILIFITIFGLATVGVFIASQKGESLFERQQELSLEMATAKATAENESKAKSQFLANVSHELRTPLNAIIGFSEIINSEAMGPLENAQYKEFIRDIHTSGVHLLSLINDILDFSKAEDNKLQVDLENVELVKLAKICLRMVLPRAEDAKVKLVENLPSEAVIAITDPKRLKQVILNLLSNSVKFTPEGGQVSLKIAKNLDNNMAVIEIADTGVGMAAQDLAKALSPFGQVDNKLSKRYEGTGLGLPLTKKLVELMKGRFDIKSEPGLGTTVIINIPLFSDAINMSDEKKADKKI